MNFIEGWNALFLASEMNSKSLFLPLFKMIKISSMYQSHFFLIQDLRNFMLRDPIAGELELKKSDRYLKDVVIKQLACLSHVYI